MTGPLSRKLFVLFVAVAGAGILTHVVLSGPLGTALAALIAFAVTAGASAVAVRAARSAITATVARVARAAEQATPRRSEAVEGVVEQLDAVSEELVPLVSRLASERQRFESVLAGMNAAVFAIDGQERLTVINPAMRRLFDLDKGLNGTNYRDVLDLPLLHEAVDEARDGSSGRVELELGGTFTRHLVAYTSPQTGIEGVAVVLRDVTNIRKLERIRRDFVANVSHELRTPVSVIRASAETLLSGALDDPVHGKKFVEAIERHSARLSNIVDGLLDLARLEAGRRKLAKEPVNVRASALRALDLVRRRAASRRIEVQIQLSDALNVDADTKGVDQILSNLLENAVKYADEDGLIVVRSEPISGDVRIIVADNGPGIEPRLRTRVFERFYRVDKGRSREQGGTGLGLAIVKHLANAMGGSVGVDGVEPHGSAFWVRLPHATLSSEDLVTSGVDA